jgi:hypothetical protein
VGEMGHGYGSEWHLLRYMGRHRRELDRRILAETGGEEIEWLDFRFDPSAPFGDRELRGVEFLPPEHRARIGWATFWPTRGNAQNWDAIGRLRRDGATEWLLVEAKGNLEELRSSCGAKAGEAGAVLIAQTFARTKRRLGVDPARDWLNGYYQYANRLAVLDFLNEENEPARLLFIYFTGDKNGERNCPPEAAGWREALAEQDRHLGLGDGHPLSQRVHKLFLPAAMGTGRSQRAAE